MPTVRHKIKEVARAHPIKIVGPTDFVTEAAGEIDPGEVLRDPKFTLYCFDPTREAAIFVESGDPVAVDRAAFYYQGQVQGAMGVVVMPLDVFHRVSDSIAAPPKGVIFVHSVGRCGSTLLSKVLESVVQVHSLSEPDDFTQLSILRIAGERPDSWFQEVMASSVKWRCKPRAGAPADSVAIKFRSEVMVLADLFGSSFPRAKHFFLYRNALSWMASIFRGFPLDREIYDADLNQKMEQSWSRSLPLVRELRREKAPMNPVQIRILSWITCMEGYLQLAGMGVPACAARFEDLTASPRAILEGFFEFCEIESPDWAEIDRVLSRDSQAGTVYDREERRKLTRELTPELIQDVRDAIASRPLLRVPDVFAPRTLRP